MTAHTVRSTPLNAKTFKSAAIATVLLLAALFAGYQDLHNSGPTSHPTPVPAAVSN